MLHKIWHMWNVMFCSVDPNLPIFVNSQLNKQVNHNHKLNSNPEELCYLVSGSTHESLIDKIDHFLGSTNRGVEDSDNSQSFCFLSKNFLIALL